MSKAPLLKGIDRERVVDWLTRELPDLVAPLSFRLIAAGGSNLTYRVEDARGAVFVLHPGRGDALEVDNL
ncbi:MAG TPA: hypothetical protein PLN78_01345, partial [Pseudomonadales bacterium]|nr:hypothetical protein [Pseudomonadales bacterium]